MNKISISAEVMFGPAEQQIELMSARKRPLAIVLGIKPGKTFERAASWEAPYFMP